MNSSNYDQVAAYRAFVLAISADIFSKIYFGFRTATLVTIHELIKGKKVWTEMQLKELAKVWFSNYNPGETNELIPVELETNAFKVEHTEVPQSSESTWHGFLRRKGFNHQEWPLQRYTIEKLLMKLQNELEIAVWKSVKKATAFVEGDSLLILFNGYLQIIKDAIVGGDITPVVTGVITEANIIDNLELMYDELPEEIQDVGTDIRLSYALYNMYNRAMDTRHPNSDAAYQDMNGAGYMGRVYREGAGNTRLVPVAGMKGSQRIIFHSSEQFHIGVDDEADFGNFNFQQNVRELYHWLDAKIGVTITLLRDGIAVVNDQE